MCYTHGLTHAEAAEAMDVPIGTVKSRLHAGLTGLRAALTPDCRGGVLGRIMQSGTLAIGDEIVLLKEADREAPTGESAGDAGLED